MKFSFKNSLLPITILLLVIYPVVFVKLDSFPIKLWDESMFATNAYEMLQRNEYLVPYFNGQMDMWNSKPPLMIWAQMLFIKTLGYNELGIRLPSAIASCLTILILFLFTKKHINGLFGFISAMILLSSPGFLTFHTGRTGDADALLTLFLTAGNFILMDLLSSANANKNKKIALFFLCIFLAFLCKGIAAYLFVPGYLLLFLIQKRTIGTQLLTNKWFWTGIIVSLSSSALFIVIRNFYQPGYFNYLLSVDAGRIVKDIENHREPFEYYLQNLAIYLNPFWFMLSLTGMIMLFGTNLEENVFSIARKSAGLVIPYLLLISLSVTKVPWYLMPAYPLLAIAATFPLFQILQSMRLKPLAQASILILLFAYPYRHVFGLSQSNPYSTFEQKNEAGERLIFNTISKGNLPDSMYVLHTGYDRGMKFYQYLLKEEGKMMVIKNQPDFKPGDKVIVSGDSLKAQLQEKYYTRPKESIQFAWMFEIISKR